MVKLHHQAEKKHLQQPASQQVPLMTSRLRWGYTDSRQDEQDRGITVKASSMSLVLQDSKDSEILREETDGRFWRAKWFL